MKLNSDQLQQLKEIDQLVQCLEKNAENEKIRLASNMKEWTDIHVRVPLDEMKSFKSKVESMPIVDFVTQTANILD